MFRIGEFSRLTQVSIRMLRYYDETGLLHPAQVDPFTGYRSYSVEQIQRLHRIVLLRDLGFSIVEMGELLDGWNDETLTRRLEEKRREAERAMEVERARVVQIQTAIADLRSEALDVHCNVTMKRIEPFHVLSVRRKIARYDCESELWHVLYAYIARKGIRLSPNHGNVAFFYDEEHRDADVDVEACVVVEQMGESEGEFVYRETAPVGRMASIMVYGPYERIGGAYQAFARWLSRHARFAMDGPSRQICHKGPWDEKDPSQYLTELQVPLRAVDEIHA